MSGEKGSASQIKSTTEKEKAMRAFEVKIEGTSPILFHNPAGMARRGAVKKGASSIPTPEEEAKASCYWLPDGSSLMFPGDNIQAAMLRVASNYKANKKALTPFVAGSVVVEPEHVPFNTKDYLIDTRRAVVQRQGILRSRAKLPVWKLIFTLLVDDDFPVRELDILKQMLDEAGRRVGIGDFRPEKRGRFGKFVVTKFQETTV
jgi:hypothetical protein